MSRQKMKVENNQKKQPVSDSFDLEVQLEQARVDETVKLIGRMIEERQAEALAVKGDIVDFRKNFWDDVTVNFEDAVETAETYASMKQQAEVLSERERSQKHMDKQIETLRRLESSPYFGRIDFTEQGYEQDEPIYLGIGSLFDEELQQYLIYDWRAPISSLYYDYGPGKVKYKTPEGQVNGEMTLKRQFIIRDGCIKSMFDAGVTIGDELLQEVLGNQASEHMKSIVATIQQEQNKIIRNEKARLLLVQGAAGSGKTSAALQRAAYLLYRHRGYLTADQIVLFSPNPMFNSYIAAVLPELGEENVEQTTFQQYLDHRFKAVYEAEDPFTQLEYVLTEKNNPEYPHRMDAIKYKSSKDFMNYIDRYVEKLGEGGIVFKSIAFRGDVLIAAKEIYKDYYELDHSISPANRMKLLVAKLLKRLTELGKAERKKDWVEAELELLDAVDFAEAYEMLGRKGKYNEGSFDDFQSERDYLAGAIVQKQFKKLRRKVKLLRFLNIDAIYRNLLAKTELSSEALHISLNALDKGIILYEDAAPYLYLKEKLEGFMTNASVKHLFIDEAQDYSAFQFHYLKKIFPNCKMTVLGDYNQTIFSHHTAGKGFKPLADLYEEDEIETIVLNKSYRSTYEISLFTRAIIGGEHWIEPFERRGREPEFIQVDARQATVLAAKQIGLFQERGWTSIAIVCKTAEESLDVYKQLKPLVSSLKLIDKETVTFEKGIAVIPVYLAKGVEFDAVIINNASQTVYKEEESKLLFYTACTRAMHELCLFYEDELTALVKQ